jgi:alcohol dehydrogenase (cytochrome c)
MTAAPIVLRTGGGTNVQICPRGGQHSGNHSIDAVNADTGRFLWRFYSVPGPGQPGAQSWKNDAWQVTSIGFWGHISWDPQTNVIMTGTGDCWPDQDPEFRPGDNLFCAALVALDVDTGRLKWYFQYLPSGRYDNDSTSTPQIYTDRQGRRIVSNFNRRASGTRLISMPARRAG